MRRATHAAISILLFTSTLHSQDYRISTIAGAAPPSLPAKALDVVIGQPFSVTADAAGNVYFARLSYLFKLDTAGTLHHIAGNGRCGPLGDDGPATATSMSIGAVVSDPAGNLFVADNLNHRIRKITPDGLVTSIAGDSDNVLGTMFGLALAPDGNLFVPDLHNKVIWMVSPEGAVSIVAGGGTISSDESVPALDARLEGPTAISADREGNVYFADSYYRIRKLSPDGLLTTLTGSGTDRDVEGGPAPTAATWEIGGVAAIEEGAVLFSEYNPFYWACSLGRCSPNVNRIRKISKDGIITTVAGLVPRPIGFSGDGGPALEAGLFHPMGLAFGPDGDLLVADTNNARIRKISPDGIITTVAGNGQQYNLLAGDGGPATTAALYTPRGLALDKGGNLYIADSGNHRVRKISRDGVISTFAGTGGVSNGKYVGPGFSGDGGPATAAELDTPVAVAVDSGGNVFIADSQNNRVRKVSPDGVISSVAQPLPGPVGLATDSAGNLYISTSFKAVYKLSPDGKIRLVTDQVSAPLGLTVDASDNLFIADSGNSRVLKVAPDGSITTVAGNGSREVSGDGGPAIDAGVPSTYVAVDGAGNLFIAGFRRIRKVSPDGIISTVAGNGTSPACLAADGESAATSAITPAGLVVDADGNLYESEADSQWGPNHLVRILRPVQ